MDIKKIIEELLTESDINILFKFIENVKNNKKVMLIINGPEQSGKTTLRNIICEYLINIKPIHYKSTSIHDEDNIKEGNYLYVFNDVTKDKFEYITKFYVKRQNIVVIMETMTDPFHLDNAAELNMRQQFPASVRYINDFIDSNDIKNYFETDNKSNNNEENKFENIYLVTISICKKDQIIPLKLFSNIDNANKYCKEFSPDIKQDEYDENTFIISDKMKYNDCCRLYLGRPPICKSCKPNLIITKLENGDMLKAMTEIYEKQV